MIIDASAIIAILRDEPEAAACAAAIEAASRRSLSAANFVEAAIVIDLSRDPVASRRFDDLLGEVASGLQLAAGQIGSDQLAFKFQVVRFGLDSSLEERKRLPQPKPRPFPQPGRALQPPPPPEPTG